MRRAALLIIGSVECLLGVFVLIVPGAWQEAVHPLAMGTVFYPIQAMAAGWILRGGLTLFGATAWARGAWLIELPVSGVFLLRAGLLGPWAAAVHIGRMLLAMAALWLLRRPKGGAQS